MLFWTLVLRDCVYLLCLKCSCVSLLKECYPCICFINNLLIKKLCNIYFKDSHFSSSDAFQTSISEIKSICIILSFISQQVVLKVCTIGVFISLDSEENLQVTKYWQSYSRRCFDQSIWITWTCAYIFLIHLFHFDRIPKTDYTYART